MDDVVKQEKQKLREEMLAKRKSLSISEHNTHSEALCKRLIELVEKIAPKSVHAYLPLPGEVDIRPFLQYLLDQKITIATPQALAKRKMLNLVLKSLQEIESGIFGTSHPANSLPFAGKFDLIIVPGLAFGSDNYRLGFGAGYYDTFLNEQPKALKVGLAFPFQMVEKVPKEGHDVALDLVLS